MQLWSAVLLVSLVLLLPVSGAAGSPPNCDIESYRLGSNGVRRMKKANLAGCDLTGAMLADADLHSADLTGAILDDADLRRANLSRALLVEASLDGVVLNDAVLSHTDFAGAAFSRANLLFAIRMKRTNFAGATFEFTAIGGSILREVSFRGATITNSSLSGTVFMKADFEGATITSSSFLNCGYENSICPDGANSDDNGGNCFGHGIPEP